MFENNPFQDLIRNNFKMQIWKHNKAFLILIYKKENRKRNVTAFLEDLPYILGLIVSC